jgi:PAS domain S-box-containing protein
VTSVSWLHPPDSLTLGRASEPLTSTVELLAGIGSWSLDLATWTLSWSDGLYRIYGFDPGGSRPTYDEVREVVHPADRERVETTLDGHLTEPRDGREEYRLLMEDGVVKFVVANAVLECDGLGQPVRYVGTVQDVTALRRSERKEAARHAVTEALRSWRELESGSAQLLGALGAALDWTAGSIWTPGVEARLECRAVWANADGTAEGLAAANGAVHFGRGVGLPGKAWASGRPLVIEDLSQVPDFVRARTARATGLRSAVAFPATAGGDTLAVLEFFSTDRRSVTDGLDRLLDGVGAELGAFLARRRGQLGGPRLSPREREVLQLAAEGNSATAIAQELTISPATVKSHFEHIYAKLDAPDRAAAVAYALRGGLIE